MRTKPRISAPLSTFGERKWLWENIPPHSRVWDTGEIISRLRMYTHDRISRADISKGEARASAESSCTCCSHVDPSTVELTWSTPTSDDRKLPPTTSHT
jgi:hypothetical protein